jgi:regulator of sirC expression with transglutaminase-like and TPR domain
MSSHEEALRILTETGESADDKIDIGDAALALAALQGTGAIAPYREMMMRMVRDLARSSGEENDLKSRILALRNTVAHTHGFTGDRDTYNDLANANLMRVIDRKKGLPVALGIIYISLARKMKWDIVGLNFPGHFLLRMDANGRRAILDPFDNLVERDVASLRGLLKSTQGEDAEMAPEHYETVSDRSVLLRLQNNIKLRLLQQGEVEKAVETLQVMVIFAPLEAMLWRELGLFQARLGNLKQAITALETFMRLGVPDTLKHQTALLLQKLKGNMN